mmetsp:Transcript_45952/g.133789  ORF Transcript_45952/g.133789 Transcript_45952/m.133789 type:complete len:231 (+) Transcript_45952:1351-2043(+)
MHAKRFVLRLHLEQLTLVAGNLQLQRIPLFGSNQGAPVRHSGLELALGLIRLGEGFLSSFLSRHLLPELCFPLFLHTVHELLAGLCILPPSFSEASGEVPPAHDFAEFAGPERESHADRDVRAAPLQQRQSLGVDPKRPRLRLQHAKRQQRPSADGGPLLGLGLALLLPAAHVAELLLELFRMGADSDALRLLLVAALHGCSQLGFDLLELGRHRLILRVYASALVLQLV